MLLKKTIVVFISLVLLNCAAKEITKHDGQLYFNEGLKYYNEKSYKKAAECFENAIRYASTPELAAKAQIYLGNSYFYRKDYLEAIPSYKQYLEYYKGSPETPEILFRLSYSYYKEVKNIEREQVTTVDALESFMKLKELYPDYAISKNVDKYIKKLVNNLAGKEYYIADFYLRTGKKKAAEKRFKYLFEHYKDSDYYAKALLRYCEYLSEDPSRKDEAIYYLNILLKEVDNNSNIPAKDVSKVLKKIKKISNK